MASVGHVVTLEVQPASRQATQTSRIDVGRRHRRLGQLNDIPPFKRKQTK
ncbi:hypothetical protein RISK_000665 [Rhodopirellula islandica]|uniref:Uncharacterized protein n=1 Tax=Rhodopirellula islandica TaxID=595434 RepID=A0A0J1BM77_RHOIS|nr:hypothetical protein RISK_000665 [Rhodopirellula islandica]